MNRLQKFWFIFTNVVFCLNTRALGQNTRYSANVREDASPGSVLTLSPSALPIPESGYSYSLFQDGDKKASDLFEVSPDGKVKVKSPLNYVTDKRNKYSLVAIRRKKGMTYGGIAYSIQISVKDVNNNEPKFTRTFYQGYIDEGLPAGSPVLGLEDCFASDYDSTGTLKYSISGGNHENLFAAGESDISGLKLLVIKTTAVLDRDNLPKHRPYYELKVQASDGEKKGEATIQITVLDKNDNSPRFSQAMWKTTVLETLEVMQSVLRVTATDIDEGSNKEIYYYLETPQDNFYVDPYTGIIHVAAPLDYRKKTSHSFKVIASDRAVGSKNTLKASTNVQINVLDVSGYPSSASTQNTNPKFLKKPYSVIIRADFPQNAFVVLAKATGPDSGPYGKLTYTLSEPGDPKFSINRQSGVITVNEKLNPNLKVDKVMTVTVRDGNQQSDIVNVKVEVKAVEKNEHAPLFSPSTIQKIIPEDLNIGETVFTAQTIDRDSTGQSDVTYSITGGTGMGRFLIDSNTGVVTTKTKFKSADSFDLYLEAKDKGKHTRRAKMYARVKIASKNLVAPVFSSAEYSGEVAENEPINAFVTAVFAENPDPLKSLEYVMGSVAGLRLDPVTGIITTTQKLDYEVDNKKYATVTVKLKGTIQTSKALVVVDVVNMNDEKPEFPRPIVNLNIPENSGYIPSLLCLFAKDRDGAQNITYSIASGNAGDMFGIDAKTGQLSVQNLDYDAGTTSYELRVKASDGKHEAYTTVKVNVEDDKSSPEPAMFAISTYIGTVTEYSAAGKTVLVLPVKSDQDGQHKCDFGFDVTPEILSLFRVAVSGKTCVIKTKQNGNPYYRWTKEKPEYIFSVRVINIANVLQYDTAKVRMKIVDTNEAPRFSQISYTKSITVGTAQGSKILKVIATDPDHAENGKVHYRIMDSPESPTFAISNSGVITLKSSLTANKKYKITVRASDGGSQSKFTDVEVFIMVHPDSTLLPKFEDKVNKTLKENFKTGRDFLRVKVSAASAPMSYEIVGGNIDGAFKISNNGWISLLGELDYERHKEHKLIVRATVESARDPKPAIEETFTVKVEDINDEKPVFNVIGNNVTVTIDDHSPKDTLVSRYRAFDEDSGSNAKLYYELIQQVQEGMQLFAVDHSTGIVTTAQEIKRGSISEYNFILRVTDQGTSQLSTDLRVKVLVQPAQIPPPFVTQAYSASIFDDSPVGQSVTSVKGTTGSDFLSYDIIDGDKYNSFCVGFEGTMFVQKEIDRDATQISSYHMTVNMKYKYRNMALRVRVNVKDNNDNAPVFQDGVKPVRVSLSEDTLIDTVVYTIKATDKDEEKTVVYSEYQYANEKSKDVFKIDANTGKITLNKPLDYEILDEHVITYKAQDQSTTPLFSLMELRVKVLDANDGTPEFSSKVYNAEIARDSKAEAEVVKVSASDFDSGENGEVFYEIVGDQHSLFKIDHNTGRITLTKAVALEFQKSFSFIVRATDRGKVPNTGQASVTVTTYTRDGPPKFASPSFLFEVTENTSPSRSVGTVRAISIDILTYSISGGNDENIFRIDSANGKIFSNQKLDAERKQKYTLFVTAKDTSERMAQATVFIKVTNENDNAPQFKRSVNNLIEIFIPRNMVIGQKVVDVEGFDLDIGDSLTYLIEETSARRYFEIGSTSGIITVKNSLEALGVIQDFTVKATDRGQPPLHSSTKVRVVLTNKRPNDYPRPYSISESAPVPAAPVISDLPRFYPQGKYSLVFPKDGPFQINENTGDITLLQKLDYEKVKQYTLIVQETNIQNSKEYVNYELRITVIDENDNTPIFTMKNYFGSVNKNAIPGTVVMKLTATDADSGKAGKVGFEVETQGAPFSVKATTSEIVVTSFGLKLDWYNISVVAVDYGTPQRTSAPKTIHIETGTTAPVFDKKLYQFDVSENSVVGTQVGLVKARSLSGIALKYSITYGNTGHKFHIGDDGRLILQAPLDYELDAESFSLKIKAAEITDDNPLHQFTNVIIQVINVNDNAPIFNKIQYQSAPIPENRPINSVMLTVSATDCDCGRSCVCTPGALTYSIDKYLDTFVIDPVDGEIRNIRPLDYDTNSTYKFTVKVQDQGVKMQTGTADVVIDLKNVNDNPPEFNPDQKTIYISENIQRGTEVISVNAQDKDGAVDSRKLQYAIETGNTGSNFVIDKDTGVVSITNLKVPSFSPTRPGKPPLVLNISAFDGLHKGYFKLVIKVDDKNDASPEFQNCINVRAEVFENEPSGTYVTKVQANDLDYGRNGEIEYMLQQVSKGTTQSASSSGTEQDYFTIDSKTGEIKTKKPFDREQASSYIVLVIAKDGGKNRVEAERNTGTCQLTIKVKDKDDEAPVFALTKYDVSVSEAAPLNSLVVKVSATDADEPTNARVEYSIDKGSDTGFFAINSYTGEITVARSLLGQIRPFSFQIQARNPAPSHQKSTADITISVEKSNPPKFNQTVYAAWIREDHKAGTAIFHVKATSQVGGTISYSLMRGLLDATNKNQMFTITSDTGLIKIAGELDYEGIKNYVLEVQARDSKNRMTAYAKVKIYLMDVNDNAPVFVLTKYDDYATVTENKQVATVARVFATDRDSGTNAKVQYRLVFDAGDKYQDKFTIDRDSGILRTTAKFDREEDEKITIKVEAKNTASEVPLDNDIAVDIRIIDQNDEAPVFGHQVFTGSVSEAEAVGFRFLEIFALDRDTGEYGQVQFYIKSGNEEGHFAMSQSSYVAYTPTGQSGISLPAGVNSSASITIARRLDRETKSSYRLTIMATDSRHTTTATVNIKVRDANDNNPVFEKAVYFGTIREDAGSTVTVTTVRAIDMDSASVQAPIIYSLEDKVKGQFVINRKTGVITTGYRGFDRETEDKIRFTVYAFDGKRTGTAIVECTIADVNDNPPFFPGAPFIRYVEENKPAGTSVGYIPVRDIDDPTVGKNAKITFKLISTGDGRFTINSTTGLVTTTKRLDRESAPNVFEILVEAKDGGTPSLSNTTTVTVKVTDGNDCGPVFEKAVFKGTVEESSEIGTSVTRVKATDCDDPRTVNAKLLYYIKESKTPRVFRVDPDTGDVTVALRLDYEAVKKYTLIVGVRDRGSPHMEAKKTAKVEIVVTDSNDNPPVFIPPSYQIRISENVRQGVVIGNVTAKDSDTGANGDFIYKLVDGIGKRDFHIVDEYFGIKRTTSGVGQIYTKYFLDRETKERHVFKVGATDMGIPPLTGYADVTVVLGDVNDNAPHFNQSSYCGKVVEEKTIEQTVVRLSVSDPDTAKFSCPCEFSIINGSEGIFNLNKLTDKTAVITSSHKFDFEKKQIYRIFISAKDRGTPPMVNVTYIDVDVIDVNDSPPKNEGKLDLLINSYKGEFKGGIVGRPYVIDNDRGDHDEYEFTIKEQSPGEFFSVINDSPGIRGGIVAEKNIPSGTYELIVESKETNRKTGTGLGIAVLSKINVLVRTVSDKAVQSSLALRMTGLNQKTTCNRLKYPEFEKVLSKILGISEEDVVVFGAQEVPGLHLGADIRFAVKKKVGFAGSSDDAVYMKPINMIPILSENKHLIEEMTGGKVKSVGIDACATEQCLTGFCYNKIVASKEYTIVTDDNGIVPANPVSRSFLSINTEVQPVCLPGPKKPMACTENPCLNGGECVNMAQGGYSCTCPKGFDGPECQKSTVSFTSSAAYIWLKPLNYFFEGWLTFEFLTTEKNGLILYQGPVSDIRSDFLAVELVDGKIRISVTQGDSRILRKTLTEGRRLDDGVYHEIRIYKRQKFIRVTVDDCRDAQITEGSNKPPVQNRVKCELVDQIPGSYSFINGLNPLQLGGMKHKHLDFLGITDKSFKGGCIRRVIDNGIMYDFANSVEKHKDIVFGCPDRGCPACLHGECDMTRLPFKCICLAGWIGPLCDRRVKSYHYLANSYSQYTPIGPPGFTGSKKVPTWYEKYRTHYLVQIRTGVDGIIVYESSDVTQKASREYSILEIHNKSLRYQFNLGDGDHMLAFSAAHVDITDGKWRNVTVIRTGNNAEVRVEEGGEITAVKTGTHLGTHKLLDSDGVVYTGGLPTAYGYGKSADLQGCLGDNRVGAGNLDESAHYEVKRFRVNVRCPCLFWSCLNGGVCMAGSPPYCMCAAGYTGAQCGQRIDMPLVGARAGISQEAYIIMAILLVIFLLALIFIALLLAGRMGGKKVPLYVEGNTRDNIMPYSDEGAGEDDFHNYDLETLLKHASGARAGFGGAGFAAGAGGAGASGAGFGAAAGGAFGAGGGRANGAAGGAAMAAASGVTAVESEPLLAKEASMIQSSSVQMRNSSAHFYGAARESLDVAKFISTRLAEANTEDAAYPRDTLLHYGYEGEGSDVDDLSELGDSEDESSDEEGDFGFLEDWGGKFDTLNRIFNRASIHMDG